MDEQQILEALGEVPDPELDIGVVDLGPVYDVDPFAEILRWRLGDCACARTARARAAKD